MVKGLTDVKEKAVNVNRGHCEMKLEIGSVSFSQCLCCGSYDIVRQSWLRVLRNVVCFPSQSRHSVSVVSLLQRKRQCQAFLCEDSAGPTCFAPTQRARSHKTSRLSSRSFPWCETQNRSVVVCTAGFRTHLERDDVTNDRYSSASRSAGCFRP